MTTTTAVEPLTPIQLEVLAFETGRWKYPGAKAAAIHTWFHGMTITRYYQILNAAIDEPAAETYDPTLVRRLRDRRDQLAAAHGRRPFETHSQKDLP